MPVFNILRGSKPKKYSCVCRQHLLDFGAFLTMSRSSKFFQSLITTPVNKPITYLLLETKWLPWLLMEYQTNKLGPWELLSNGPISDLKDLQRDYLKLDNKIFHTIPWIILRLSTTFAKEQT